MIKFSTVFIAYFVSKQSLGWTCFYELDDFRLLKETDYRICIKFSVKNEIVCEMVTKTYDESAWVKQGYTSGISNSKMAVKAFKMMNAPTHQQLITTWRKWKKWLWTIAKSQSQWNQERYWHIGWLFLIFSVRKAKFVLKLLNFRAKQRWMEVAQEWLNEVSHWQKAIFILY